MTANQLVPTYLEALLSRDRDGAVDLVMKAVDEGMAVEDVLLSVIQPAQYELGRLWEENRISVAQEHFSSAVAQLIISRLYGRFPRSTDHKGTIVAACVDEELHEMGIRIVADFFTIAGWEAYYIGANAPVKTIREAVRDSGADVVAISTTMQYHLATTQKAVETLLADTHEKPLSILVGGYAFNSVPSLVTKIGAHGWAPDAREAVRLGERLVFPAN